MNRNQTTPESLAAPISDDQLLLVYVRDRDVHCPLCGYNVRGLTIARCPECGKALKLSVGLAEPFLKAWITCAVVTCLSAGLGICALVGWASGANTGSSLLERMTIYSFVAMIFIAAVVLWKRRPFMRQNRQRQMLLAAIAVAVVVLQFAMISTVVRSD